MSSKIYVLPQTQFQVAFTGDDNVGSAYHSSVCTLLDMVITDMIKTFKPESFEPGIIINNPAFECPKKIANENKIWLDATPGTYWSQFAYQCAHEFCHYLIDSPWPPVRDEWFEEAVCEAASRFWLYWLSKSNFCTSYSNYFAEYADNCKNDVVEYDLKDLSNEDSELLNILRENHEERKHLNHLVNKMMPIFLADPSIWEDIILLKEFSDSRTFLENLQWIKEKSKNQQAFQEIIDVIDSKN